MPISSGYGPGTSFTNVQGPSGMDVSPFLAALLAAEQRHLSQRAAAPRMPAFRMAAAPRPHRPAARQTRGGAEGDRTDHLQERLLKAKVAQEMAKARAATGRVPTRMSTVGGQTFATPDHLAMTGAERQAFLPNAAHQIGGFGENDPADEDFLIRMRAGRTVGR